MSYDMDKTRKITPVRRRKKKKALTPRVVYWLFVVGMAMLLSSCVIGAVNEVFSLQYTDQEVSFIIPEGASLNETSKILKEADLISNRSLFKLFFRITAKGDVRPGGYTANTYYDYRTITKLITRKGAARETVRVTIPEGYEIPQIINLLVENGVCEKYLIIQKEHSLLKVISILILMSST